MFHLAKLDLSRPNIRNKKEGLFLQFVVWDGEFYNRWYSNLFSQ